MGFGTVAAGAVIASALLFALAFTMSIAWNSLQALSDSLQEARIALQARPRLAIVDVALNTTSNITCIVVENMGPVEALLSNGTIVIVDYYDLSLGGRARYVVEYHNVLVEEVIVDNETVLVGLQGYTLSLMPNSAAKLCFNIPSTLDTTSPIVFVFCTTRGAHSSLIFVPS